MDIDNRGLAKRAQLRRAAVIPIPFCLFIIAQSGMTLLALTDVLVFLSFGLYPFVLSWQSDRS